MVETPVANTSKAADGGSGANKTDGEKLSKWAAKKKKMSCYRCSKPGHFAAECTNELCDYCLRLQHTFDECTLLSGPKQVVNIYGVCCQELMFFETPDVAPLTHVVESSFPVVVKV